MVVTRTKKTQKTNLVGLFPFRGKFRVGEGSSTSGGEVVAQDRRDSKHKASVYVDSPKKRKANKTPTSIRKKKSASGREMRMDRKQAGKVNGLDRASIGTAE